MKFFARVKAGDYVVTPYSDRPLITANKSYKVVKSIDHGRYYDILDDSGQVHQYNGNIFFEADTYWTCVLMRTFSLLMKVKLKLLLP